MWLPARWRAESKRSSTHTASRAWDWNLVDVRSSSATQEFLKRISGEGDPRARLDVLLIKTKALQQIAEFS